MVLVDSIGGGSDKINLSPLPKKHHPAVAFLLNFSLILFFSAFVFFFINVPAYVMISRYKFAPQSIAIESPEVVLSSGAAPKSINRYEDNTIVIPKIGVNAPVLWDVGGGKVMESLQSGVVHLAGTVRPGETGNSFLTGHSSNYWWRGGDYNSVFALLPELKEEDDIFIIFHGKIKKYKVKKMVEVRKSEVSSYVTAPSERLTLMTCTPIGTNLRRLLVIAEPVGG